MSVILRLEDFSFTYPETQNAVLTNVSLEIEAGRCYCLTGPTGSGKTTLALALKGLLGEGSCSGRIDFPARSDDEAMPIGIVLQDPEVQLLTSTVGAEVAFGLENLCIEPGEMPGRVAAALEAVGLDKPLRYPVDLLSMGQKYRLLIAALLVMEPGLLILDEPAQGCRGFGGALRTPPGTASGSDRRFLATGRRRHASLRPLAEFG
jgi:energy-coupling factor transporter ATP-binding protein EcfA2